MRLQQLSVNSLLRQVCSAYVHPFSTLHALATAPATILEEAQRGKPHCTLRFCSTSTPLSISLLLIYTYFSDTIPPELYRKSDTMIANSLLKATRRLSAAPLAGCSRFLSDFTSSPGVIDGRAVAKAIKADLRKEIEELREHSIVPGLSVILVGNRTDSATYVSMKQKACAESGIESKVYKYKGDETEAEILQRGTVLYHH